MNVQELDKWWANLTIAQKERISSKIATAKGEGKQVIVKYPECSKYWGELAPERKEAIYKHCTGAHGEILKDWSEGKSYSF